MKVWLITMGFPVPSETFVSNDVLALHRMGVEVAVHCLRPQHPTQSELLVERNLTDIWVTHNSLQAIIHGLWIGLTRPILLFNFISWIVQNTWKKPTHLFKSLALLPRSLQIFKFIEQERPEVVYLYWSHYPSLIGQLVQTWLAEIVVAISFIAYDMKEEYACSKIVTRNADIVQTVTSANIPAIEKLGVSSSEILVSHHGIDTSKIPVSKEKIKRRIVTAGRLITGKGMDDVLQVFKQVLAKYPDASLVILGDGAERKNLETLACSLGIEGAVSFRGHVSHENVLSEMAKAEVFLFLSKSERLPNVVKEAMACRCLCVVTQTPGIEELLSDGQHGYVVSQGDLKAAVQKVNQAFVDSIKTQQMVEAAHIYAKNNFDINRIMENLHKLWHKRLNAKASLLKAN
ncbi:MAG: glycosyltransferase [Scytonematopsis contorta HA4267-MV1]|jgi:glycosyltransferase involved in cell wall biosynthesis|nr:glycosyltransferase [Scytonematopsis contorta HA4267-MV1]